MSLGDDGIRSGAIGRAATWRRVAALPLVAAFLVGCGAAATPTANPITAPVQTPSASATPIPSPTPLMIDVCQVVTKSDAESISHTPENAGVPGIPSNPSCTYDGPVTGPLAHVEVHVGDGAKKFYDIDRGLAHQFTAVPGIADEAWLEPNAIFFRKGTIWVGISVVLDVDNATVQASLPALARTAASRIPS